MQLQLTSTAHLAHGSITNLASHLGSIFCAKRNNSKHCDPNGKSDRQGLESGCSYCQSLWGTKRSCAEVILNTHIRMSNGAWSNQLQFMPNDEYFTTRMSCNCSSCWMLGSRSSSLVYSRNQKFDMVIDRSNR